MNLYQHISKVLEGNAKFCQDGILFKNTIVSHTLRLDSDLITLLLEDDKAREHFFTKVNKVFVFDKIKFQKFISNKQFLPDSFTAYKNKIGLTANEDYLTDSKEVVLAWAYKDCVLEGGQSKEDQKKKEIFWNQTLSSDEIDVLLAPKVFTNWKRIGSKSEQALDSFSEKDNLVLKGNNLLVLHSLQKTFRNKVKLIYIDPPYNTGNDSFQYNDSFNHSSWLTFMKNRLEIAWQLLHKNGALFIQVDDSEYAYLKVLCDELFGRDNFREAIVLKSSTESGVNAINVKRGERLFKVKEYILFYSKSTSYRFKPFYTKANYNTNYKYEVKKKNGSYSVIDLSKKFKEDYKDLAIPRQEKDLLAREKFVTYALKNAKHIYSLEKNIKKAGAKFKAFAKANKDKGVSEFVNSLGKKQLVYKEGVFVSLHERLVTDDKQNHFGVLASDLWVDIGTTPANEGGIKFNNGKKPEKLLKRIIEMSTEEGDLVLDYHLGSGTTAAVAHKMKRQYIGIEQMDYGDNDSTVRLKNVINGEQSGVSKILKWQGGGSYVFAELAKDNAIYLSEIEKANSLEKRLQLLKKMKASQHIHYRISLEKLTETSFKKLKAKEQIDLLTGLLDKNNLYVNYSEIDDADYNISDEDKRLNKIFYNK